MKVFSTRGGASATLTEAISRGLAPDGGLYMPPVLPAHAGSWGDSLQARALTVLRPYFEGEPLGDALPQIVSEAFTFDAPTRWLEERLGLLELFHGPTAAFKDFGARFLAACLARLASGREHTVLVATSGDTGAAVASAFHRRKGFRVVVLYPDGRVSPRQAHQLGAFQENVLALRVAGSFDDCQRLVKAAFSSGRHSALVSANSISLGRLLPQMAYYAHASLEAAQRGSISFAVPTGNLGNAFACLLARERGLPIERVVLATNANRVLAEFVATGVYSPQPSVATLANAMDVGAPSNVERLRHRFPAVRDAVSAEWVDDETIRSVIRRAPVPVCPHTACGLEAVSRARASGDRGTWVVAATAHPAKFETIVEPLRGHPLPVPAGLAALLERPASATPMEPTLEALEAFL